MIIDENCMIGKTVSHYKILEKLGEGGMGVVYRAQDLKLDRPVAIKFLPSHLSTDENAKKRFIHEAKTSSSLDHPHINNIHDIDETPEGQLFIVMAFYEGRTLRQKIEQGLLSVGESLELVSQIASGLAKAHESGIIHRDIKPANVLLTGDGQAKIVDFGLAKLTGKTRVTKTGTAVGTVAYMSPEQARGEELDGRSDIFSLGTVLYELLTGQPPFKGDHEAAVLYGIAHTDPEPLSKYRSHIPDELRGIVNKALKKNRDERYQTVTELKNELDALRYRIGEQTSSMRQMGLESSRSKQRKRNLYLGIGVVVVLLAAGWVYRWNRREPGRVETTSDTASAGQAGSRRVILKQVTFAEGVEEYPAFSPDEARLAFCTEINGYRHIIIKDLETGEENRLTEGSVDNIQPAWFPNGKAIVFVRSHHRSGKMEPSDVFGIHDAGDVWLFELESGKETKIVENAYNPSFSPDGSRIAFDASWAGPRRIWTADNRGRNPEQVSSDSSEVSSHIIPRWSPDNKRIVFQHMEWTNFDIKVVDVISRKMKSITNDRFTDLNPVWSHTGNAIYFSSYRSGGLNVWSIPVSLDGSPSGLPRQITTGAGQDVQLALSPDGRRLAMSILLQNADIWKLPVTPETGRVTGEPRQVITTTREDSRGGWSPDGKKVAFNSDRTGNMNIWIHSLEDGMDYQVTDGPGGDYQANWSPDGEQLVFFSSRSGNADIWLVEIATRELKRLTQSSALDINPFFSPDGGLIAYQSDYDGRREVWVMKADGTEKRQLTSIGVHGHFLIWSQDGLSIIFHSLHGDSDMKWQVSIAGGDPEPFGTVKGGAHMSFSPDYENIMDVVGHKTLWVSPLKGRAPYEAFAFENPDVRIDYPVWSPGGQWILFDRFEAFGGDIWFIENLE